MSRREAWRTAVDRLGAVQHQQPRAARQAVPARVLRWHAPARHDRRGAHGRRRRSSSPTSPRPRSTSPCSSRCSTSSSRSATRGRRAPADQPRRLGRRRDLRPRARHVRRTHRRGPPGRPARARRSIRTPVRCIAAVPDMETDLARPLATVPGRAVDPSHVPAGCAYAARCPLADDALPRGRPRRSSPDGAGAASACWHAGEPLARHPTLRATTSRTSSTSRRCSRERAAIDDVTVRYGSGRTQTTRGRRREPHGARRRDPRARRRVRVGQVDASPAPPSGSRRSTAGASCSTAADRRADTAAGRCRWCSRTRTRRSIRG